MGSGLRNNDVAGIFLIFEVSLLGLLKFAWVIFTSFRLWAALSFYFNELSFYLPTP